MFDLRKVFHWNPEPAKKAIQDTAAQIGAEAAEWLAERMRELAPVDTGFLVGSIGVYYDAKSETEFAHTVYVDADYAQYIEFGYYSIAGTWIAPRPFMRQALAEAVQVWPEIAGKYKIGQPGKHLSEAKNPQQGVPRHHTYSSTSHHASGRGSGDDTGDMGAMRIHVHQ